MAVIVIRTDAEYAQLKEVPIALTIGNFDGLHLGHISLISRLKGRATELGLATAVMTFDPHPAHVIIGPRANFELMTLAEKIEGITRLGIDYLIVQQFDRDFSNQTADEFLANTIDRYFIPGFLLVGYDFRFGRNREGDLGFALKHYSPRGVLVEEGVPYSIEGHRVSSSLVRGSLLSGEVERAGKLLGYAYTLSGLVIHGKRRGRQFGFPTANIGGVDVVVPKDGVYVVEVLITDASGFGTDLTWHTALMNIGNNPTFEDVTSRSLEVFILSFFGDIYGDRIFVRFLKHIRDEIKFPSVDALKAQVAEDIAFAQKYFDMIGKG